MADLSTRTTIPSTADDRHLVIDCPTCKRTMWAGASCPACLARLVALRKPVAVTGAADQDDTDPPLYRDRRGRRKGG